MWNVSEIQLYQLLWPESVPKPLFRYADGAPTDLEKADSYAGWAAGG